jgi:hypothetical protein
VAEFFDLLHVCAVQADSPQSKSGYTGPHAVKEHGLREEA